MRVLDRLSRRTMLALTSLAAVLGLTGAGYALHAAAVTSRITATMASNQSSTLALGTASYAPSLSYTEPMTDGTGNDQFKVVYADTGTIAASDSLLIDLNGGAVDAFGATIACVTLKGLMVIAPTTNTNDLLVGGATVAQIAFFNDTSDVVAVRPGGVFLLMAPRTGYTVTAASRDKVRLKNSAGGASVKYSIQALCR